MPDCLEVLRTARFVACRWLPVQSRNDMTHVYRALALCGSDRPGSWNQALLSAAIELAPSALRIVQHSIRGLPFFDPEIEKSGPGQDVQALYGAAAQADALLLVTPEYNQSPPASLKNALDWLSRKPDTVSGKPAGLMGASPGQGGTVQIATSLDLLMVNRPEVLLGRAHEAFRPDGRLADAAAERFVRDHLAALLMLCQRRDRAHG
jgi:chromate reductase, NAD(P)H dehydrogenase (quinone)